jgi:hypothetical protein
MLIAAGFLGYFGVRALTQGSAAAATANAHTLVSLERTLGIYWEPAWQQMLVGHRLAVTLMNWVYIWGHWPVIAAVAIWLYLRLPDEYRLVRNAFFISGAIGMAFFIAFPVAPPRLVDLDFTDTVARYSHAYRALQPPSLVNRYAAFPSLHFGWDLLVGIALARHARSVAVRAFGFVMPVAMAVAVGTTANHWVIDIAAGGAVALTGLALATMWDRRTTGPDRSPIGRRYHASRAGTHPRS